VNQAPTGFVQAAQNAAGRRNRAMLVSLEAERRRKNGGE
jgi:hypothetical protein